MSTDFVLWKTAFHHQPDCKSLAYSGNRHVSIHPKHPLFAIKLHVITWYRIWYSIILGIDKINFTEVIHPLFIFHHFFHTFVLFVFSALEGVTRSLNNLLERFHQSFFFYIMTSTNHFVSIGLYMMPYGLIVLPIALTTLTLWIHSCGISGETSSSKKTSSQSSFAEVLPVIFVSHLVGLASFELQIILPSYGVANVFSIVTGIAAVSTVFPLLSARWRNSATFHIVTWNMTI